MAEVLAAEGFDTQFVEKLLADIEGNFSQIIEEVLEKVERKGINKDQRVAISLFIAIQLLRTKEHRNDMAESQKQIMEGVLKAVVKLKFPEATPDMFPTVEIDPSVLPIMQASVMLDFETIYKIAKVLNNHIWMIGINTTDQPLFTSDHPVVKNAYIHNQPFSYWGLASEGIEVAFPLTPKYILIIREKTFHKRYRRFNGKTIRLLPENIPYFNSLQVRECYRQVYCPTNAFSLAEQVCALHPEVCLPTRQRIQTN